MHSKQMRVSYSVGNKKNKHVCCKHIAVWSDLEAGVKNRITDHRNSGQSDKYVVLIDTLISRSLLVLPALCGGTLLSAAYSGIPSLSSCRYHPARGFMWNLVFMTFSFLWVSVLIPWVVSKWMAARNSADCDDSGRIKFETGKDSGQTYVLECSVYTHLLW